MEHTLVEYYETLFNITGLPVLFGWITLIFFPKSKLTARVFKLPLIPAFFALCYSAVVMPTLFKNPEAMATLSNPTLYDVKNLLSTLGGATAGWIHFLCFDLLVGSFIWKKAIERSYSFYWVSPTLFCTLMLGPLGWLIFETIRFTKSFRSKRTSENF